MKNADVIAVLNGGDNKKKLITQTEIAKAFGVNRKTVYRWLHGADGCMSQGQKYICIKDVAPILAPKIRGR